jgi:hypothetical protein
LQHENAWLHTARATVAAIQDLHFEVIMPLCKETLLWINVAEK